MDGFSFLIGVVSGIAITVVIVLWHVHHPPYGGDFDE